MDDPISTDPKAEWPRARLRDEMHAIKVIGVQANENGTVSVQAAHNAKWYTLDAEWAKKAGRYPAVGDFLVHFPSGIIALTDSAFIESNVVIDEAPQ